MEEHANGLSLLYLERACYRTQASGENSHACSEPMAAAFNVSTFCHVARQCVREEAAAAGGGEGVEAVGDDGDQRTGGGGGKFIQEEEEEEEGLFKAEVTHYRVLLRDGAC